jgi:hypothetical protein
MKVEKVGELNDKYEIVGLAGSTAAKLILSVRLTESPSKTVNVALTLGRKIVKVLTVPVPIPELSLTSQLSDPVALNLPEKFKPVANGYAGLFMFKNQLFLASCLYLDSVSEQQATLLIKKQVLQNERKLKRLRQEVTKLESDGIGFLTLSEIPKSEGETLEFKSAACWNSYSKARDEGMVKNVIETVAAFMNSQKGGTLLIGVGDDGTLRGLADDYTAADKAKPNRDGYELFIRNALNNNLGADCIAFYGIRFAELDGKDVCSIDVIPATKPVYYKGHLFVRNGNQTRKLNPRETVDFLQQRNL